MRFLLKLVFFQLNDLVSFSLFAMRRVIVNSHEKRRDKDKGGTEKSRNCLQIIKPADPLIRNIESRVRFGTALRGWLSVDWWGL